MATNISFDDEDFYDLSLPVFPGEVRNHRTDIMLVQFLVQQFLEFGPSTTPERAKWNSILARATAKGGRFDDGKYGPLTREAVLLFEKIGRFPFKDGIVRVVGAHLDDQTVMKLKRLNSIFSAKVGDNGKKAFARANMNPLLFNELYPGG